MPGAPSRFRDQHIVFHNGIAGRHLEICTGDPRNYHEAMTTPERVPPRTIDGQLFVPQSSRRALPAVIVVPGSLGIAPTHLRHAETFTEFGIAAFVIDPFGARNVTSTVANQTQYSFAASAYDVLAALRTLAALREIDPAHIGAQGHSRGGGAVLTAAVRRFSVPVLGEALRLRAVYAAYPWCGHQFLDPDVGDTLVRAVIGDRDEWCSVAQLQGHIHAIRLRGGRATLRIVGGAGHSFDRDTPIELIPDAAVAPDAPIHYIADDGSLVHPLSQLGDPALTDRDLFVYGLKAGFGKRGARIGSREGEPEAFREDMVAFWKQALLVERHA